MCLPLMVPKGLIGLIVRDPIRLHEVQRIGIACSLEDLCDVLICARFVAVLRVGAIAVVWPQAVNRPGVGWAGDGVGVPELNLLD